MSKFRHAVATTAIVSSSILAVTATATADTAGTKLSATPSSGLTSGQKITVKGSGYLKNVTIYVVECKTADTHTCDTSHLVTVKSDAKGSFTLKYKVFTGSPCAKHKSCLIGAGDAAQGRTASAKISFK